MDSQDNTDPQFDYFRIVVLNNLQIMVERHQSDDEDYQQVPYCLTCAMHYRGVRSTVTYGYDDEKKRDDVFFALPDTKKEDQDEQGKPIEVFPFELYRQFLTYTRRIIAGT